jgi:hypothetical protein
MLESEMLEIDERGYHLKTRNRVVLMDSCQAENVQNLAPILAYVKLIATANWHPGIPQGKTFVHLVLPGKSQTSLYHHYNFQSYCQGPQFPQSCQNYRYSCLLMGMVLL